MTPVVEDQAADPLAVVVKVVEPFAAPSCPKTEQETVLTLDEPLDNRAIQETSTGWTYRLTGDRFDVMPKPTPCGRADCSTPSTHPSPCQNMQRAYFVARDGSWRIVTYASGMTCDAVAEATHIRFPAALCG